MDTNVVHTRLPARLKQDLEVLVEEGYYSTLSDALRDGARKVAQHHDHVIRNRGSSPRLELKEVKL